MTQIITQPILRVKVTGVCNRTCSFCNEEGDMRNIGSVRPDDEFFECVHGLAEQLHIHRVMLTGGEPTVHPELYDIVDGIKTAEISITTNGIRFLSVDEWSRLRESGLQKVIVSIHDATPQSFLQLETRSRNFGWAVRSLDAQRKNIIAAAEAGLRIRVNVVAYDSSEQVHHVFQMLEEAYQRFRIDVRLLNDLANLPRSQAIIHGVCQTLNAHCIREERRAGSSNTTSHWETESGFQFSTKMAYPYFLPSLCNGCTIKSECHEGFYGVRVEQRSPGYWVRLCLYKQTPDVLMPWEQFLQSEHARVFRELCSQERS